MSGLSGLCQTPAGVLGARCTWWTARGRVQPRDTSVAPNWVSLQTSEAIESSAVEPAVGGTEHELVSLQRFRAIRITPFHRARPQEASVGNKTHLHVRLL